VAAVVAGKDELKQAAKRVRESSKRKPRDEAPSEEKPAAEAAAGAEGAEGGADELRTLRSRVAELTAENAELRRQVAQLQAALPEGSAPF
jgi:predicted RNase H-like nuclease (RuvC/YqgF family)